MNAQEKWLKENTVYCERFQTRMSRTACEEYSKANPGNCKGCAGASQDVVSVQALRARKRTRVAKTCTVPGCGLPHSSKGLCKKHYHRARYQKQKPKKVEAKAVAKVDVLVIPFAGDEQLLHRLQIAAQRNGSTPADEAKVYIQACLDHYGVTA